MSLSRVFIKTYVDNKISREEFLKYYIGNEINPKFESFLKENNSWRSFFKKYKKIFRDQNRLVEFSKKLDYQSGSLKISSQNSKGEKSLELQKKWLGLISG